MPLNIPTPQPGVDPARNMMPPLTSPSHPMAQRQVPDLQPYNPAPIQGKLAGDGVLASLGYSSQNMPSRQELGNVMQYGHRGVHAPSGRDLYDFSEMRSAPSSPWYQQQPQQQQPLGQQLQQMIGGVFGRQPQRQVQQTSPGAGYGQSPSNPMTQQQPPMGRPMPDLQPYTGWDQIQQQIAGYGAPPRYVDYGVGSASAPWAVGPGD